MNNMSVEFEDKGTPYIDSGSSSWMARIVIKLSGGKLTEKGANYLLIVLASVFIIIAIYIYY